MKTSSSVFVHCRAGAHRAATLVAAILLHMFPERTLKSVIDEVKSKRPVSSIQGDNRWFLLRLKSSIDNPRASPAAPAALPGRLSSIPEAAPAAPGDATTAAPLATTTASEMASALTHLAADSDTDAEEPPQSQGQASERPPAAAPAAPEAASAAEPTAPQSQAQASEPERPPAAAPAAPEVPSAPAAAPAAELSFWDKVQRLLIMSWNPGAGCSRAGEVLDSLGYHIIVMQEVSAALAATLPRDRWSVSYDESMQLVAARLPAKAQLLMSSVDRNFRFREVADFQKDHFCSLLAPPRALLNPTGRSSGSIFNLPDLVDMRACHVRSGEHAAGQKRPGHRWASREPQVRTQQRGRSSGCGCVAGSRTGVLQLRG